MFIGTPSVIRIVWRRFYLKLGLEQRFGVLNSGSLFSSPPLGGDSRSNLLGLLNPDWKVRGESPRFTQDWRRVRERGVPFPPGVLSTLWEYKREILILSKYHMYISLLKNTWFKKTINWFLTNIKLTYLAPILTKSRIKTDIFEF